MKAFTITKLLAIGTFGLSLLSHGSETVVKWGPSDDFVTTTATHSFARSEGSFSMHTVLSPITGTYAAPEGMTGRFFGGYIQHWDGGPADGTMEWAGIIKESGTDRIRLGTRFLGGQTRQISAVIMVKKEDFLGAGKYWATSFDEESTFVFHVDGTSAGHAAVVAVENGVFYRSSLVGYVTSAASPTSTLIQNLTWHLYDPETSIRITGEEEEVTPEFTNITALGIYVQQVQTARVRFRIHHFEISAALEPGDPWSECDWLNDF